jgi:hypothetical protein
VWLSGETRLVDDGGCRMGFWSGEFHGEPDIGIRVGSCRAEGIDRPFVALAEKRQVNGSG